MSTVRASVACCVVGFLSSCDFAPAKPDAGVPVDAGTTVVDAGTGLEPLPVEFVSYAPPARALHQALVSDGTTVFDASGSAVAVSTDVGRTWLNRGLRSGQLALVGSSTVYVLGQAGLSRSDDAAATFIDVTLPTAATPATVLLATTTDGAVWVSLQTSPPELYRSTDQGASFQPVPLPSGTTVLRTCPSFDGTFVALRNASEVMRFDGTRLVTLAAVSNPSFCIVTRAGTVLVAARDTGPYQLRLPAGAMAPERQTLRGATAYLLQGNDVVRTLTDGSTDRSGDDGTTWTSQVTTAVNGFGINTVVAVGTTLLTASTQGMAELTAGASAWRVFEDPGLPPFLRVVDFALARRTAARALLLEDNTQRTLFVSADSVTWTRGVTLSPQEARAVTVSPSGDQVFVGGNFGAWRILGADGRTQLRAGTLGDGAGRTETNPIQQALWDGDATGSVIVVSTANDADSAGEVLSLDPASTLQYWAFHTPTSTTTQASWRPGGYHALAISPSGGTLNRRLFASFRSLLSANSWSTNQLVWNRAFDSQAFWEENEGPIAGAALAASYSPAGTGPLAVLWSEGRLRVGNVLLGLREVPTGLQLADAKIVRFSSEGRLWIGGPGGLFFTRVPVVVP